MSTKALSSAQKILVSAGGSLASRPLWSPLNEASLVAWWDAASGVSLSGSNVVSWTDRKNGIVASQATSANRPTFSAVARGGKPGLQFSGSSQFLAGSAASIPVGAAALTLAGAGYSLSSDVNPRALFSNGTPGASRVIGQRDVKAWGSDLTTAHYNDGAWAIEDRFVEWVIPAGTNVTATTYGDGIGTAYAGSSPASVVGNNFAIGQNAPGADMYWSGTIQQVLVFSAALSDSTRLKLEGWESWNDGKSGTNLGVSHPYKSRPPYTTDP